MAKKVILITVFGLIFFSWTSLYAKEQTALTKLTRGVSNLAMGWVEIPKQMMSVKKEHGDGAGDVAGFFWGTAKGFAHFLGRTAVGAYETVTFFVPSFDPVIEPEYVFSEEERNSEK
jgi:putative exosortase-associated protein (TIGR04073 family)